MITLFILLLWATCAQPACTPPGKNIWHLADDICVRIEAMSNSALDVTFASIFDVLSNIESIVPLIESSIDTTQSDLDRCCSALSAMDRIIISDIDSVLTKIDSVSTQLSILQSDLDACCSTLDIFSNGLVGTSITQAMIPYTITTPGHYTLCESVTANGSPAITIGSDDVYLHLNGHTITSNNVGILCTGHDNIAIYNGVITASSQAIAISASNGIQLLNITAVNCAAPSIDIQSVSDLTMRECVVNGNNGTFVSTPTSILLSEVGNARIYSTDVFNQTFANASAFLIRRASNTEPVILTDCNSDTASIGFYVLQDTNNHSNVIFRNCYTTLNSNIGFYAQSAAPSFNGPYYENCLAERNSIGFESNSFKGAAYKSCVAQLNTTGFLALNSSNAVFSQCIATNNTGGKGFDISTASGNNTNIVLDSCLSANNLTGYSIDAANVTTILTNCMASNNTGNGINNSSATTFIVDCRTQHAATSLNPAYNLNVAADVLGAATVITTS